MRKILMVTILGLGIFSFTAAFAEDLDNSVRVSGRSFLASDVKADSGDILMVEARFNYDREFKIVGELPLVFSLNVTHINIDESVSVDLPAILISRGIGLGTKFPVPFMSDDRYFFGFDVFPTFKSADGYHLESHSMRVPFRSYFIFKQSDEFILAGGAEVRPLYDDEILPVLGLIYKPNDRLSFNLATRDPNIAYKLDDKNTVYLEMSHTLDEFEFTKGDMDGVIVKYQNTTAGFGLEHQFNKHIKGFISAGAVFNRKLEYINSPGKVAIENGPYVGFGVLGKF